MRADYFFEWFKPVSFYRFISFFKEVFSIITNFVIAHFLNIIGISKNSGRDNYNQMKKDMKTSPDVFYPSKLWNLFERQFSDIMTIKGIDKFKETYINNHLNTYKSGHRIIYEGFIWQYYQTVKKMDYLKILDNIEEPLVGGKTDFIKINNKRITIDLLQAINDFYNIFGNKIDVNKKMLIMELGAGYGKLIYVILKTLPNAVCVILDLPSSLLIAEFYLPKVVNIDYVGYKKTRLLKDITREVLYKKRLWFFGCWRLNKFDLDSVDIFVNINSFQEMRKEQIIFYLKRAGKITTDRIYLREHIIEKNPINEEFIAQDCYKLDEDWKLIKEKISVPYFQYFEKTYDKAKKKK